MDQREKERERERERERDEGGVVTGVVIVGVVMAEEDREERVLSVVYEQNQRRKGKCGSVSFGDFKALNTLQVTQFNKSILFDPHYISNRDKAPKHSKKEYQHMQIVFSHSPTHVWVPKYQF